MAWRSPPTRDPSHGGFAPSARLFERLVRDAQGARDLAAFRNRILENVASEIGADSGSLMDPPGMRLTPSRGRSRVGMLSIDPSLLGVYAANKARYESSNQRLLRAMESGRSIIDSDVYGARERERLAVYAEILLPQGARSLLSATIYWQGQPLCQLVLKRHGRGAIFRDRDAEALDLSIPALALADAGFQYSPAASRVEGDSVPPGAGTRPLGSREAEVAVLVCKGMRNREIAMLIGTSCETVKKQVHSVFTKVGVSNRAELAGLWGSSRWV
jgi:DNA-binding CsgD family transcriptional regulator